MGKVRRKIPQKWGGMRRKECVEGEGINCGIFKCLALYYMTEAIASEESPPARKIYDEISFERRKKFIELVTEEKWTIRAAAREIGIKHCTAKHILYLYRKKGRIIHKKEKPHCCDHPETPSPQYIFVPFPVYIVCNDSVTQVPINLEHTEPEL